VCAPNELRLHPALDRIGWAFGIDELGGAARTMNKSIFESILITANRTVLSGFGAWRLAILQARSEVQCVEYPFSEDDALQFMIIQHLNRRGWNDFVRICLALARKPHLQEKALENIRAGGKDKGLTNLSKADRKDVRRAIADIAGTGTSNVSKVGKVLERAHPSIISALVRGLLSIHRAWQWCDLSKSGQKEEFSRLEEERTRRKIVRDTLNGANVLLDSLEVIKALQQREACQPGSVRIRASSSMQTEIKLGRDLLEKMECQKEPDPHA
jgi:hypothetical protein